LRDFSSTAFELKDNLVGLLTMPKAKAKSHQISNFFGEKLNNYPLLGELYVLLIVPFEVNHPTIDWTLPLQFLHP